MCHRGRGWGEGQHRKRGVSPVDWECSREPDQVMGHSMSQSILVAKASTVCVFGFVKVWEKAGAQGLLGVNSPSEHGGIGADILYASVVWEEQ